MYEEDKKADLKKLEEKKKALLGGPEVIGWEVKTAKGTQESLLFPTVAFCSLRIVGISVLRRVHGIKYDFPNMNHSWEWKEWKWYWNKV